VVVTEGLTILYGLSHQRQKSPTEQVAALSAAGPIEAVTLFDHLNYYDTYAVLWP
jgi:hypothetical protein